MAAGDYYLAIQAVTTNFNDYLSLGVAASGAAQSNDGGTNWAFGYGAGTQRFPSVAVSLTGELTGVPEPASLVLFGFGLAGLAAARAKRQSSAIKRRHV